MLKNWEQWKTEPGIPEEPLYMYYTDQTGKYNPNLEPTSIVITGNEMANMIFGFTPTIVNCDVKSQMFNGVKTGKHINQIEIAW